MERYGENNAVGKARRFFRVACIRSRAKAEAEVETGKTSACFRTIGIASKTPTGDRELLRACMMFGWGRPHRA